LSDLVFGLAGEELLELIQSFSHPILDLYFGIVTTLGDTFPIIVLIVLLYYTVNKDFVKKLAYLIVFSAHMYNVMKIFFHNPRPYVFNKSKYQVTTNIGKETVWGASNYSFPSGHSQTQGAFWGFVFSKYRSIPVLALGILLLISIPISRSYLGVHWVSDIIFGLLFGFIISILFVLVAQRYGEQLGQLKDSQTIIIGLVVSIALFFIGMVAFLLGTFFPFNQAISLSDPLVWENTNLGTYPGILAGLVVGLTLEKRYIDFPIRKNRINTILRIVLGLASVIILYLVFKAIEVLFEEVQLKIVWIITVVNYISFFFLAFTLAFIIPWLFVKIENRLLPE
jgi:undecaprenyl-diphosphatase